MKIEIILFKVENCIIEEVDKFANSFSNNLLKLQSIDCVNKLLENIDNRKVNILILNISSECNDIINFLNTKNIVLSKIILLSTEKEKIFDFIKFDIFDFLHLPIKSSEILLCINRCLNKINEEVSFHQLKIAETRFQKFIPINSTKKIELIKLEDIICFEADGRYTLIYLVNGISKIASKNLGEFQKLLDPDIFCRIHHKFIINMYNLTSIIKSDGYYCEMKNNKNIPISKRKLDDLNSALNIGKHFI